MKKIISMVMILTVALNLVVLPVSAATTIELNRNEVIIRGMGKTYQLIATTSSSEKVTWKSGDTNIAKVSNGGLVTTVKKGEVTITATVGKVSAECKVTVSNEGGNASAIEDGDWTYYSTNAGLYKVTNDGKAPILLVEGYCTSINVYDDYVYFIKDSTTSFAEVKSICRIKNNGKNFKELKSDTILNMSNISGTIYYALGTADTGYKICRMSPTGKNSKTITTATTDNYTVKNGWVYYTNSDDEYKLYKIKTDGTGNKKVSDDICGSFKVEDGVIYYLNRSDGQKLYSMDLNGKNKKKLNDTLTGTFQVDDDMIYYMNWGDNGKIYKMNTTGKSQKSIGISKADSFVVKNDWIYYSYDNKIYRIKTSGNNKKTLFDGGSRSWVTNGLHLADGWIYFQDFFVVHKIGVDGKNLQNIDVGRTTEKNASWPLLKYSIKNLTDKTMTITAMAESGRADLSKFVVYDNNREIIEQKSVSGKKFKADVKITKNGHYDFYIYDVNGSYYMVFTTVEKLSR